MLIVPQATLVQREQETIYSTHVQEVASVLKGQGRQLSAEKGITTMLFMESQSRTVSFVQQGTSVQKELQIEGFSVQKVTYAQEEAIRVSICAPLEHMEGIALG